MSFIVELEGAVRELLFDAFLLVDLDVALWSGVILLARGRLEIFREGLNALHLSFNDVHGVFVPKIVFWLLYYLVNFDLVDA